MKLSSLMSDVLDEVEAVCTSVDVIKLDGIRRFRRFGPPLSGTDLEIRSIVKQRLFSAAAYLVTFEGAQKLLTWSSPYSDLVDAFVFNPRNGYRLFQLFPGIAIQGGQMRYPHRVEGPAVPTESVPDRGILRKPESKGPLWFRLSRECRLGLGRINFLFGGDQKLIEKGGWIGVVPLATDLCQYS